jgi:hypothetical protein
MSTIVFESARPRHDDVRVRCMTVGTPYRGDGHVGAHVVRNETSARRSLRGVTTSRPA